MITTAGTDETLAPPPAHPRANSRHLLTVGYFGIKSDCGVLVGEGSFVG